MKEGQTLVYASGVKELEDGAFYDVARSSVSPARREKADRFAFERDRRLCLGAGLLLNKALTDAGIAADKARIVTDERGKPYLQGGGAYFSLSHSGEYVLCAVSAFEVGCDAEKIKEAEMSVAQRFFCDSEYRHIAAQETEELRRELFYRYWTLKESFIKATGEGLSLPLNSFAISLQSGDIRIRQSYDKREYSFAEFGEIPGYRIAVCTAKKDCPAELRQTDLSDCL